MRWGVTPAWHDWYAWHPVRLIDGRWVWLETVQRGSYFLHDVPINARGLSLFNWVYRLRAEAK